MGSESVSRGLVTTTFSGGGFMMVSQSLYLFVASFMYFKWAAADSDPFLQSSGRSGLLTDALLGTSDPLLGIVDPRGGGGLLGARSQRNNILSILRSDPKFSVLVRALTLTD